MEKGGKLSRTFEGGHEPFYDFPCSLCDKDGKHMEAARYCKECCVYMCDPCVRNHDKYPLHSRHKLLQQSQFTAVSKSALKSFPITQCLKHPGELINIFCKNHDVVCCSVCKATEHNTCTKTQHLPDAAKGIQLSQEYKNTKKETKKFLSQIDTILSNRKADNSRIVKEKERVRHTIADFRKKINNYFDDLQKNCLAELDIIEKRIFSTIDHDINYLVTAKAKAEDSSKKLESFKGDNECELFIQVITSKLIIREAMDTVLGISTTVGKETIQFNINPEIERYLRSIEALGAFEANQRVPASADTRAVKPNQRLYLSSTNKTDNSRDTPGHFQGQQFGNYYVKEKFDTNVCNIWDICQLHNGDFLITDYNNKKLERLDQSYKLTFSVQLDNEPFSVCAVGSDEAAVSLWWQKKIQIVSVGRKMTLTRLFNTYNHCRGITSIDDILYVCCGDAYGISLGCIEVYNKAGQLQHCIPQAPFHLSSVPLHITASDDGKHLYVTSYNNDDIISLDLAGNVVNTFRDNELRGANVICTDGQGHVFVCGIYSKTIHKISLKNQKISAIVRETDGIKEPLSVCYDRMHSRLLVSCESDNLQTFTIK